MVELFNRALPAEIRVSSIEFVVNILVHFSVEKCPILFATFCFSKLERFFVANANLSRAKNAKNDEFYTQYDDIEKECERYRDQFFDKVIYCNCDDPESSNFFLYFANNFKFFGLKKLITTHYDAKKPTYKLELTEEMIEDGAVTADCAKKTPLKGNGDFRNAESIELLKEADIVITNPPFSLFREYVAQLVEFDKQFLIMGNNNSIAAKEIFKLIKEGKVWLGYGVNKTVEFALSDKYEKWGRIENGVKYGKVPAISWFTNLETTKRHEELILYKKYSPEEFPRYENYDAIEVSRVVNIPMDYKGVMGVPVTFLDKFNPDQFEIVGMCENEDLYGLKTKIYNNEEKKEAYFKKFGKNGQYDLNASGVLLKNGILEKMYSRILIKHKKASK